MCFPPKKLRVCERFRSPVTGGKRPNPDVGGTAPAKAGDGRSGHRQERVPDALEAREPFWREPCAGAPLGTGEGERHMAPPHTRSPVRRGNWNRTAVLRRLGSWTKVARKRDSCRSERCWDTRFISARGLRKGEHAHPRRGSRPRCLPGLSQGSLFRGFFRSSWSTSTAFLPRLTSGNARRLFACSRSSISSR